MLNLFLKISIALEQIHIFRSNYNRTDCTKSVEFKIVLLYSDTYKENNSSGAQFSGIPQSQIAI